MVSEAELQSIESREIWDPEIPTLSSVLDQATMRQCLRQVICRRCDATEEIRFQILKHHPGSRCTLDIAFLTARGWDSLIGKVYAIDRPDVYHAMVAINQAGFQPEHLFSIPKPLAYIPDLRLLLQEKCQGRRAKEVFLTGNDGERTGAAERCAEWLAEFHAMGPRSGGVLEATNHLQSVARWSQRIANLGEPFPFMVGRLARLLEDGAVTLKAARVCASHGSYNCNQIILAERRTIVFDWDSYAIADPCRDVARFLVALQRLGLKYRGSIRALDRAAEIFIETYEALNPCRIGENLLWYKALTCLILAKYEAHRPVCTFRDGIEALISEGLRALGVRDTGYHGQVDR